MEQDTSTSVIFAADARKQLYAGLKIAADAVGTTLGPRGKTVLIQRPNGSPLATKDGVSVAKAIRLKDPVQRMGAELVIEAANETNEVAGDGTTTATVLTAALVEEGMRLVEAGYDSIQVCSGIEHAAQAVLTALKTAAKKVSSSAEIEQVATISANGDTAVGQLIAQAMEKVGRDGIITVEDAKGMATSLDVAEGMQFDRGYVSPFFVTDGEKMRAVYQDAAILVTDKKLSAFKDIVPVLEQTARAQRGLLIIAEDFEGDAMTGMVVNRVRNQLPIVAVKAPGYGQHRQELLQDLCVLTGATLVSAATGHSLEKLDMSVLGSCKKVVVDAKTTTVVAPDATQVTVDAHVAQLRSQVEDVTLSQEGLAKLRERIAKLAAGVAVIKVGGATELEMLERKARVEDAVNATKAAADEGVVPGGGMALYNAANTVPKFMGDRDFGAGVDVVLKACLAPLSRIASNAGASAAVVLDTLKRANESAPLQNDDHGFNAATGRYEDLAKAGVIDPVKVSRAALQHAVSVAVTFLSLDAVIHDDRVEVK